MKKIILSGLAVAWVLALCSCTTMGKNFKEENLSMLNVGETTYDDACRILGANSTSKIYGQGYYLATWQYIFIGFAGSNVENKQVIIMFNDNDVMNKLASLLNIDLPVSERKRLGM